MNKKSHFYLQLRSIIAALQPILLNLMQRSWNFLRQTFVTTSSAPASFKQSDSQPQKAYVRIQRNNRHLPTDHW